MATKLPKKKPASKKPAAKKSSPPPTGGDPMRDLQRMMAKQNFQSMEEIEAFMTEVAKGPIPKFEPENDKELAEELVYRALEVDDEAAYELVDEALALDPDCIMAYVALAGMESNPAIALAFYERGIHIGADHFLSKEYLTEYEGHFWGFTETRPFMRSLQGAADCHFFLGHVVEAMAMWLQMIELNTNDNQGVRYDLMLVLAGAREHEKFEELDKKFSDDATAAAHFNRVLNHFTKEGAGPKAQQALEKAMKRNVHVVPLLLERDPDLLQPHSYILGSKEEAHVYLRKAYMIWWGVSGAIEWLKKVAPKRKK